MPKPLVPPLIKEGGEPFTDEEIARLREALAALDADGRDEFRSRNASAIADHQAPRMLLVSGPGTGKSHLFRSRIKRWLKDHPHANVAVATFVRKLVHDLRAEIANDPEISGQDAKRVSVNTLHTLARGIVEKSGGTAATPMRAHIRMAAGRRNEEMIWADVLCLHPEHGLGFPWEMMLESLYQGEPLTEDAWEELRATHLRLQKYYNALTFPDLILFATAAVAENPGMARDTLYVIDEFQDFNPAEAALIRVLARESAGQLLVGDDDQVLYDELKLAFADVIRGYYQDEQYVNAMLPYCSRCEYHICRGAEAFLQRTQPDEAIRKVFLPMGEEATANRVRVVASTSPAVGVDQIEGFLQEHEERIRERQGAIEAGDAKDPYLLILTPAWDLKYLRAKGVDQPTRLRELLAQFAAAPSKAGDDYWRVRDYYFADVNPHENFGFRKVLDHEHMADTAICALVRAAVENETALADLREDTIRDIRSKCAAVREILKSEMEAADQVEALSGTFEIADRDQLVVDLERWPIAQQADDDDLPDLRHGSGISAVQVESFMGAKGLSADHVFILGCDDVSLGPISPSSFFVAITRARQSLTLLACMRAGGATGLHEHVRALPDAHCEAILAKAATSETYDTIPGLQYHLEAMHAATERSKQAQAAAKRARRRREG